MSKSLQECAIYVAEQFEKNKVWYSWYDHKNTLSKTISKDAKHTSDCAHFVSLVLQEYGVIPSGTLFYLGTSVKGSGASKIKSSNKLTIKYPKKSLKKCIADGTVKPGDILGYSNPHTEIYLGKVDGHDKRWSGGKGGCQSSGGKYYFKKSKLYSNCSTDRQVQVVIRIKDLNLGNVGTIKSSNSSNSSTTSVTGDDVVKEAKKWIGVTKYSHENTTLYRCDCVGFVRLIYDKVTGTHLKSASSSYSGGVFSPGVHKLFNYFKDNSSGAKSLGKAKVSELKAGDILFYISSVRTCHCGIYDGNGKIIHSTSDHNGVVSKKLDSDGQLSGYAPYAGAFRLVSPLSAAESAESRAVKNMLKIAYSHLGEGGDFIWKWSKFTAAWCAMFVCWTVYQGFGDNWTKYIKKTWMASIPRDSVKSCGASWVKAPGKSCNSTPQPGDIWAISNSGGIFGHTGLVYSVNTSDKSFMSIEGNHGNKVASVNRKWSDCYCIARPKWGAVGDVDSSGLTGGESSKYLTDNGGLMMPDNIAKLYSSDNYSFIEQERKEKTVSEQQGESLGAEFKKMFENLSALSAFSNSNSTGDTDTSDSSTTINNVSGLLVGDDVMAKTLTKFNYKSNNSKLSGPNVESINLSDGKTKVKKGQLLSYPSLVEAPCIVVKLGGVTIGGYGNFGDSYPNYLDSMTIEKTSGKINKYTINLSHQVRPGEDPNFIDKLLSKTGFVNKINILYGDCQYPGSMFRDDEAIVTDVTFNEDVGSHKISYVITALSSVVSATSVLSSYASKTDKPSNLIRNLLYSNSESSRLLLNSLPGMKNRELVESTGLIPNNDAVVSTQKFINISPLSALSYYVSGMYNAVTGNTYYMTINDDVKNEYGGAYIKINEMTYDQSNSNYFEVDVGYPGDNFVMGFDINSDVYFPLVYDYNNSLSKWVYDIDNKGNVSRVKTNPLLSNNSVNRKNVIQGNWWKKVTEYPISATLTIKGLTKPITLGSYIKINTMFYGSRDLASGIYVVVGQIDELSGNGYRTKLSLVRVGAD